MIFVFLQNISATSAYDFIFFLSREFSLCSFSIACMNYQNYYSYALKTLLSKINPFFISFVDYG